MTITSLDTIACEEKSVAAEASEDRISLNALPKLVWVGAGLFMANLIIGFVLLITPSLTTDPYGREVQAYDSMSSKMSPFTEVVDMKKHKVKLAAKAYPVSFVPSVQEDNSSTYESARAYPELDMPVRTERALYTGEGGPSLKVSDKSTSYDMPRATYQPSKLDATTDVAPRRVSELQKNAVVIN